MKNVQHHIESQTNEFLKRYQWERFTCQWPKIENQVESQIIGRVLMFILGQ